MLQYNDFLCFSQHNNNNEFLYNDLNNEGYLKYMLQCYTQLRFICCIIDCVYTIYTITTYTYNLF